MDEQLLIQQILKGNTESFRLLYRLHVVSALQLAMSVCKQKENAEEVVQNSFISAFKYLSNFRNESSFKTWLLKIVFNEAIRMQKAEKKYQWQEIKNEENAVEMIVMDTPLHIEQKETKEDVARILLKMNEKESVMLNLFYLEELSIKEITAILGFTDSNV